MKIKEELKAQVIADLKEAAKGLSREEMYSFISWMAIEYQNYMRLTRDTCMSTLYKFDEKYPDYRIITAVLKKHMDEYASLQTYFIIAMEHSEEVLDGLPITETT